MFGRTILPSPKKYDTLYSPVSPVKKANYPIRPWNKAYTYPT